jgi:hypothetical protein
VRNILKKTLIVIAMTMSFVYTNAQMNFGEIYKKAIGSTVTVETDIGFGSGFFVRDSIIVTNYHVIDGAKNAVVQISGTDQLIEVLCVVAYDRNADLVLLKVDTKGVPLSIDTSIINIGDEVLAIGSPSGLSGTISNGILSAVRDLNGIAMLQFSASVSPGSSGGPLFNTYGKVIGVVVGAVEGNNLNLAIYVKHLADLIGDKTVFNCSKQSESSRVVACDMSLKKIQDNAKLTVQHLGNYISIIGDKQSSIDDRTNAKQYANDLFADAVYDPKYEDSTRSPKFQVSRMGKDRYGKEQVTVNAYPVKNYFVLLEKLPYNQVIIEWTDVVLLGDACIQGTDGITRCAFVVRQVFKGIIDGKLVYQDITDKIIEVIVKECSTRVNGEKVTQCCVKLGDIYVENTY